MDEVIKRLRKRGTFDDDSRCYYYDNNYYYNNCCSTWCLWGRWVFVAAVIIVFFILFSVCACITRRRRRRGLQPYYGTGWMPFRPTNPAGDAQQFQNFPPQHQQYDPNYPHQSYDPNYPHQSYDPNNPHTQYYTPPTAPAPPYTPSVQTTGTHFPSPPLPQENQFGHQPPLQSPGHNAYGIRQQSTGGTGGTEYYLPPPGPPPAAHVGKY